MKEADELKQEQSKFSPSNDFAAYFKIDRKLNPIKEEIEQLSGIFIFKDILWILIRCDFLILPPSPPLLSCNYLASLSCFLSIFQKREWKLPGAMLFSSNHSLNLLFSEKSIFRSPRIQNRREFESWCDCQSPDASSRIHPATFFRAVSGQNFKTKEENLKYKSKRFRPFAFRRPRFGRWISCSDFRVISTSLSAGMSVGFKMFHFIF